MPQNLPARIDRAAIERIIQRAAELQTGERDLTDGLSSEEVLALGKDVGIPERYLQQAILEERSRVTDPRPTGLLDRAMGPGVVLAHRVIAGAGDDIERRLLRWMDQQELFAIQRQQPGRIAWEPLSGMQGALRRSSALFSGKRPFMLGPASLVSASVTALEPGFHLVALSAELRSARGALLAGIVAAGTFGIAASAALAVMSPLAWVAAAPVPFVLGLGWVVGRQYGPIIKRTRLGLERVLDHLERADGKERGQPGRSGGVMEAILDEVRRRVGGETP